MQQQRSAIAGLNILHDDDDNVSPSDDTAPSPNIAEQLNLWSTFAFESDEPFGRPSAPVPADAEADTDGIVDFWEALGDSKPALDSPPTPTATATTATATTPPTNPSQMAADPAFDLGAFLAGFSVDPFLIPPPSSDVILPSKTKASGGNTKTTSKPTTSKPTTMAPPPSKRARKSMDADPIKEAKATAPIAPPADDEGSTEPIESGSMDTPVTAAEDKRRRNTAASARFRAKKKEREMEMERKSKGLESRVSDLERECEALRRENGWLKGLVVGSTTTPGAVVPTPQSVMQPLRGKRRRDEAL